MYSSRKYPKPLQFWLPICWFTVMYKNVLFVITSEDLMIYLQCQLFPFAMQLSCLIFDIYIYSSRRPFPSPIYGYG